VVTEDGYILKIFRVKLIKEKFKKKKGVIFFMHGIVDSSDAWIVNGEKSPAYIALHQGYDVWMGN